MKKLPVFRTEELPADPHLAPPEGIAIDVQVDAKLLPMVRDEAKIRATKYAIAFIRSPNFEKIVVDSLRENLDTILAELMGEQQDGLERRTRARLAEVWEIEVEKQVRARVDEALARVRREMLK